MSLDGVKKGLRSIFFTAANFLLNTLQFLWERKFTTAAATAGTYYSYKLADYFNYYHYDEGLSQDARLVGMGIVGGTTSLEILKNLGLWFKHGHTAGQYHNQYIAQAIVKGDPGILLPIITLGSGIVGSVGMDKLIEAGEMFPDDLGMQFLYVAAGGVASGMMTPRAFAYGHRKLKYGV